MNTFIAFQSIFGTSHNFPYILLMSINLGYLWRSVIVGSIFDGNQQNKTRLENHFYHRDVITIAKLKSWAPCAIISELKNVLLTYNSRCLKTFPRRVLLAGHEILRARNHSSAHFRRLLVARHVYKKYSRVQLYKIWPILD